MGKKGNKMSPAAKASNGAAAAAPATDSSLRGETLKMIQVGLDLPGVIPVLLRRSAWPAGLRESCVVCGCCCSPTKATMPQAGFLSFLPVLLAEELRAWVGLFVGRNRGLASLLHRPGLVCHLCRSLNGADKATQNKVVPTKFERPYSRRGNMTNT